MRIADLDEDELRDKADMANRMTDAMIRTGLDHRQQVVDLMRGGDLVWGVWQMPLARHGAQAAIIKGFGLLTLISQGAKARPVKVAAIRFKDAAEAHEAWQTLGDGRSQAA